MSSGSIQNKIKLVDHSFFEKTRVIDAVVKFYCEDSISRISSNSKDTIGVNKKLVAVRFMEMTILHVFRIFKRRSMEKLQIAKTWWSIDFESDPIGS